VGGFILGAAFPLIECPAAYVAHVLGYGSVWGVWGITYWVRATGLAEYQTIDFRGLSMGQNIIMAALKLILIGSVSTVAWLRRKADGARFFATLGIIWTLVFVFAPGAVVQYMPWFAPFILLLSPRWWAWLTGASTVFMVSYYHPAAEYQFPWVLAYPKKEEANPWSNLPWAVFIGLLIYQIWKARNAARLRTAGPALEAAPEPEPLTAG
jgi:hypothetical protein